MNKYIEHQQLETCEVLMSYQNLDRSNFMWFVKTNTRIAYNTGITRYSKPFIFKSSYLKPTFYTLINTTDDIITSGVIPHVKKNLSPSTENSATKQFLKSTKLGNTIKFKK
mgnify:CR=1 FL=1